MMMRSPAGVAAVAALSLTACSSELSWDIEWSSLHFRYHARVEDERVCESVTDTLESHFALVQGYLGFEWPAGEKVDYYKFINLSDFQQRSGCPSASSGCAPGASVLSPQGFHQHELVHAYLSKVGNPPDIFLEGIAEALDCGAPAERPPPETSWTEVLGFHGGGNQGPGERWFVGFLLHRYGPASFLELYRTVARDVGVQGIDQALSRVYGVSASTLWSQAVAEADPAIGCVELWACSRPEMLLDGAAHRLGGDCSFDDGAGTFLVPNPGPVIWSADGSSSPRIGACDDQVAPWTRPALYASDVGEEGLAHFAAGRHFLSRPGPPPARNVSVRSGSNSVGPDCTVLEPWTPARNDARIVLLVPEDGRPWYVRLRSSVPRTVRVGFIVDANPNRSASLCASCVDDACLPLDADRETEVTLSGDQVVKVTSMTAGDSYTSLVLRPP